MLHVMFVYYFGARILNQIRIGLTGARKIDVLLKRCKKMIEIEMHELGEIRRKKRGEGSLYRSDKNCGE
jgi:hypothetical protein